jgi:hypothetical protein
VTVTPTLRLTAGLFSGDKSATLAPGEKTVFKLTDNGALAGSIYNARNGTSVSQLVFTFAPSLDGFPALATYALSNFGSFTL